MRGRGCVVSVMMGRVLSSTETIRPKRTTLKGLQTRHQTHARSQAGVYARTADDHVALAHGALGRLLRLQQLPAAEVVDGVDVHGEDVGAWIAVRSVSVGGFVSLSSRPKRGLILGFWNPGVTTRNKLLTVVGEQRAEGPPHDLGAVDDGHHLPVHAVPHRQAV